MAKEGIKIVAKNNKAHHDYFIEEKFEAGIEHGAKSKTVNFGSSKCM